MAKQKGFIKLKGSLGGLTFYRKDGGDFIKTTSGVDGNRIKSDPAFKRTRENMREFGGAATVGKALRTGFASILKSMSDSGIVGRITGIMKRINSLGPGIRGQRGFEILPNRNLLEGFEFAKSTPLETVFYAPAIAPTLDADRNVATWVVPDFNTSNYINPPEGATHFRLLLVSTVLSDHSYSAAIRKYVPMHPSENEANGIALSTEIPLGGMAGSTTTLIVDLGFTAALPANVGVVCAVGIIFYQEINSQFYELAGGNAMRIAVVG